MKGATVADNDFFEEAIKETEKVTGDDVENADGKKSYRYFKKEHVDKAEVTIMSMMFLETCKKFPIL